MRYAIISDIHANRQALNAVLADLRDFGCDQIVCLGDVLGYGPSPAAVLEKAHSAIHYFVMGNHDAALCGKLGLDGFNENARRLAEWTAQKVSPQASGFISGFPYLLEGDGFCCAHAEFERPNRFSYLLDPETAAVSWRVRSEKILFVGHTHVPSIFVIGHSGTPHLVSPVDFLLEEGKRYIVNPGSVGQPRDGDARAGYCLLDTDANTLYFRRIPFDIDGYREDLLKSGIPITTTYFIEIAENKMQQPVRDLLDFTPCGEAPQMDIVAETRKIQEIVKSARRWKSIGLFLLILLVLTVAISAYLVNSAFKIKERHYPALGVPVETALPSGVELLRQPSPTGLVSDKNRLDAWSVTLQDSTLQSVMVEAMDGSAAFRVRSKKPLDLVLASLPVPVRKKDRMTAKARFDKVRLDAGVVKMLIRSKGSDGLEVDHAGVSVEWLMKGAKPSRIKPTTMKESFKDDGRAALMIQLEGFQGELVIRDCSLKFK